MREVRYNLICKGLADKMRSVPVVVEIECIYGYRVCCHSLVVPLEVKAVKFGYVFSVLNNIVMVDD
jgi:hypothetical protein